MHTHTHTIHVPLAYPALVNIRDPDSLFEILCLTNDHLNGGLVLRTHAQQTLTARKLGAISSSGRLLPETTAAASQPPGPEEVFRCLLVSRPSLVIFSPFIGAYLVRGKSASLECTGASAMAQEAFHLRRLPNATCQLLLAQPTGSVGCFVDLNRLPNLSSVGSTLFSQFGRSVTATLWNVPSPVSSAVVFVISSIGPLTWYIPNVSPASPMRRAIISKRVITYQK
ncbi:unnamed protein product [Protopolystoma xenopodis]|uniref:Uncharacterized protein n=1 Tax=Protopolystoma xenopodis TaxID=117903 RepID=A0A3S5FEK2_9PLAT|nr:unnamed protein product [Protopolystoma xenopodis]